nr:SAM domain-containing protein SAMSN-1 [Loxodonta africana]
MGTLNRLQKLVWTKKASVQSRDEVKLTLTNLRDEDDTLISCMKLAKSQEKKVSTVSPKKEEEMEIRLDSISASLGRCSNSNRSEVEDMLSHYEDEGQMWNSWKSFPENPLWTCLDFQISQVGPWVNCPRCTHHPFLKSPRTDMDLPHPWVSF